MYTIAWFSIGLAILCAFWILMDEVRHPQPMKVMNVVWPVTALYLIVFAVWGYYRLGGRKAQRAESNVGATATPNEKPMQSGMGHKPTASQVGVGTSHCGAGCMIVDVCSEFGIAAAGITLLGSVLWAEYAIDFVAASAFGIVFQYSAISPRASSQRVKPSRRRSRQTPFQFSPSR